MTTRAWVLAALVGAEVSPAGAQEFECAGDRGFSASFSSDREDVRVRTGEETYELELAGRDGGALVYSDDDDEVRLTLEGDRARLRIPDEDDLEDCEAER